MSKINSKIEKRMRRHRRIRAKVHGTSSRPRLSVFKSNRAFSVQLIDDEEGRTLAAVSSRDVSGKTAGEKARTVGNTLAAKARAKGVHAAVFDRGGYRYAGAIKAAAEGAREAGLKF